MRGEGFFPCTVQGMRERGIFSFSKENSSFFAQVRMSMRHECRVMRPPFSFPRKKTGVARPKERRFPLQASSSKSCNACRLLLPARALPRLALLYDLTCSYHPLLRSFGGSAALRMRHTPCGCRSAHLVEVRSNSRLLPVSTMRRAQQCRIRQAVCRRTKVTRASR